MKIKNIPFAVLAIILCINIIACNSDNEERENTTSSIVGTWASEEGETTFNSDGSGLSYNYDNEEQYDFTYKLKGDMLTIILSEEFDIKLYYKIEIEDDVMVATEIDEGGTTVFYRQSSSDNKDKNYIATKIVGQWKSSEDVFIFYSNGKGVNRELNGDDEFTFTYSLTGNRITFRFANGTKVSGSVIMYGNEMYLTINDMATKYTKE